MPTRGEKARKQAEEARLPPWTPFERVGAAMSPEKRERLISDLVRVSVDQGHPMTHDEADVFLMSRPAPEAWQNSRYFVLVERDVEVDTGWPEMIWLSIRRNDRQRPGPERWRDFQRIKNEIIGPEHEAVELYPAELRVADCADQFHLFVLADARIRFPFGFRDGLKLGPIEGGVVAQSAFDD